MRNWLQEILILGKLDNQTCEMNEKTLTFKNNKTKTEKQFNSLTILETTRITGMMG